MTTRLEELRAEGNALFAAKQFAEAVDKYSAGLEAANAAAGDVEQAALDAQRVLLWNNRAACLLQLEKFAHAEADCSLALAVDGNNAKARYRRAQAHVGLGNLTEAFQDVRLVLQLSPSNKAAVALARKIKETVQEDAHGLQKALDAVVAGVLQANGDSAQIVGDRKHTEEALQFLEMKAHTDLASLPAELERRGGIVVLWRAVAQLLDQLEDSSTSKNHREALLSIVGHVATVLSVASSASVQLAGRVFETSANGSSSGDEGAGLHRVIELLHAQVALEYSETADASASDARLPLKSRKAIVKLCAFVFRHLMLAASANDAQTRRVLDGILHGLRSREFELQIAALDGLLHFISVAAPPTGGADKAGMSGDEQAKSRAVRFATLAQELGLFPLLHSKAAGAIHATAAPSPSDAPLIDIILSRLPLVFTQCLAQFENNDAVLKRLVRDYCVSPVLVARAFDRPALEAASSSCLLLSALFLSNAKLALWAVQQTNNDGTAYLSRIYDFLEGSRTFDDKREVTRQLQEIWVDCVASVCGVENGTPFVPPVLRVEIYKMLRASLDDEDLVLRASALSIQVKIAIVEKTLELETVDGQFLMDSVFEVLENAHRFESKAAERQMFWSGASPKERGIEALSYLITQTEVKEEFVKRREAIESVFSVSFPSSTDKTQSGGSRANIGYRSNVYYGIGYIMHHTLTAESAIKKKQMDGMEMTAEQYEELQKALKQKSVLDDGDSPAMVQARVRKLAASREMLTTLVQLLKYSTTRSENAVEMAVLSALNASEVPEVRGSLVQCGVFQSLIPLALHAAASAAASSKDKDKKPTAHPATTKISNAAGQAMARILISTNPNLIPSSSLLSSIRPLLDLCKGETQLLQFEALMALTNIASVSDETKNRIIAEPQGLSTLQYLQFSEHELVRRAATEAVCNLLPHDEVIEKVFMNEERLRLWLAFASAEGEEEDFETARAAGGALAMVSQVPAVSWLIMKQDGLKTFAGVVHVSKHEETIHRGLFALENMFTAIATTVTTDDEDKATEKAKFVSEVQQLGGDLKQKISQLISRGNGPIQEAAGSCLAALGAVTK